MKLFRSILIILTLLALAGYSLRESAPPEDSIPPSEYTPSATWTLTLPPTESLPAEPTATETLAASPTLTSLPTFTVTVGPDFSQIKVVSVSVTASGILLRLSLPGVTQAYPVRVDGKNYECTLDAKYPDNMFCKGPMFKTGELVSIEVLPVDSNVPLYATYFAVSNEALYTATAVGSNRTWCPQRGTNVTCETENRVDDTGSACIVSTCFDACGYYYSIDTCVYYSQP